MQTRRLRRSRLLMVRHMFFNATSQEFDCEDNYFMDASDLRRREQDRNCRVYLLSFVRLKVDNVDPVLPPPDCIDGCLS